MIFDESVGSSREACGGLIEDLEKAAEAFWNYQDLEVGELYNYRPFSEYRGSAKVSRAYQAMLKMPSLWSNLIDQFERLQSPLFREKIYKKLQEADPRENSWFSPEGSGNCRFCVSR